MTGPDEGPRETIGEDDGVLDPADSLETDDLDADPLDTGIEAADRWSSFETKGTTADETRRGESLDELLSEEEADAADESVDDRWAGGPGPRSGRLVADDERADADELLASDTGVDSGASGAEEAAVHVTDQDADRRAVRADPDKESLDEAIANMEADDLGDVERRDRRR
ncbi:DUF5709 domain-containing protein [Saccharopolyspora sp. CA-218241]|uniref:DUF5709 domain-containing protein n=1 Tax=Saccharopolyspora sp. CA-218241 TaxID=3240027 RepID=UPI003D957BE6